jgi:broad specificity phosphatase PhoE
LTTFYLLRHGRADFGFADERRLIGGYREYVPLTPLGREQVETVAESLRGVGAELILTSPITRALQSAAMLSRALDLPLSVEFDLHEWIPDLTWRYDQEAVADAAYREMMDLNGEWPAGETRNWELLSTVRKRVTAVLQRYTHLERVIVVAHNVVIYSLTGQDLRTGTFTEYAL